ncbi:Protein of unknown function [Thermomonospora echinospora]|uniref:DUF4240 domain-containing protein n=1 Tax=Thermomonospora echinospora TaxID=1992 RepID=A0A1H6DFH7_9ACTN|nr:DUF4240 domain-containing protein [Thermomonospora echinospora]SEG83493.1 Protein of unknown function [Thermomonospora echinospora]
MAHRPAVDAEEFWAIVEAARADAAPFHEALTDRLATCTAETILEFEERFDELDGAVYRWDVWATAHLIGGGCSDDGFTDFRAGLIALGRHWYARAAQSPDNLADHPDVLQTATEPRRHPVFYEQAAHAAGQAYTQVTGGNSDDFHDTWDRYRTSHGIQDTPPDLGEDFDFDDADQMHRRLPRLAALYLGG